MLEAGTRWVWGTLGRFPDVPPFARSDGSHGGIGGGDGNNNNDGGDMWGGNWGDDFNGDELFTSGLSTLPVALWDKYNEKLASNPLETKALTSLVGFTIGDLLAQSFLGEKGAPVDLKRLAR